MSESSVQSQNRDPTCSWFLKLPRHKVSKPREMQALWPFVCTGNARLAGQRSHAHACVDLTASGLHCEAVRSIGDRTAGLHRCALPLGRARLPGRGPGALQGFGKSGNPGTKLRKLVAFTSMPPAHVVSYQDSQLESYPRALPRKVFLVTGPHVRVCVLLCVRACGCGIPIRTRDSRRDCAPLGRILESEYLHRFCAKMPRSATV